MDLGQTMLVYITRILLSSIAAVTACILLVTTVSDPHYLKNFHPLIYIIMDHFHSIQTPAHLTLSKHILILLIKCHMVMTSSRAIAVDV